MPHKATTKSSKSGDDEAALDRALEPILRQFITTRPDQLNAMWECVERMVPPPIQKRLMHLLSRAMGHSNPELRQRASRVLLVVGPPAIPVLEAYLHSSRKTAYSVALIETLAAIGATLECRYHAQMLFMFMITMNTSSDAAVRTACAKAVATLRRAEEKAAKPAGHGGGSEHEGALP
jgi:hypothetical protein